MKILYDLSSVQPSPVCKFHGGGKYGESVFLELIKYSSIVEIEAFYSQDLPLPIEVERVCKKQGIILYDISSVKLEEILDRSKCDIVFLPLPYTLSKNIMVQSSCQWVGVFHGLRALELYTDSNMIWYHNSKLKGLMRYLLNLLNEKGRFAEIKRQYSEIIGNPRFHCITASNHSKFSIRSFFPNLSDCDVKVFYPPGNSSGEEFRSCQGLDSEEYFLMLSANRWEKNVVRAVWAFDEVLSENKNLHKKIVITGITNNTGWQKKVKNRDAFIFLDYVDTDVLNWLHANAYAFVYPSLNEGFGLPLVESMKHGVPILASGAASITEVCGDAAWFFDPRNVNEIKNRIYWSLDTSERELMTQRARERFKFLDGKQRSDLNALIEYLIRHGKEG
ncbi:MAG: glycosyltransferase [Geobacter sp.]